MSVGTLWLRAKLWLLDGGCELPSGPCVHVDFVDAGGSTGEGSVVVRRCPPHAALLASRSRVRETGACG